jgi:hypothetical protein
LAVVDASSPCPEAIVLPAVALCRCYQLLLTMQPCTFIQFVVLSLSHALGVPLQVTPLPAHKHPVLAVQAALLVASLHVDFGDAGVPVQLAPPLQ